jgi:hypothetical protein
LNYLQKAELLPELSRDLEWLSGGSDGDDLTLGPFRQVALASVTYTTLHRNRFIIISTGVATPEPQNFSGYGSDTYVYLIPCRLKKLILNNNFHILDV